MEFLPPDDPRWESYRKRFTQLHSMHLPGWLKMLSQGEVDREEFWYPVSNELDALGAAAYAIVPYLAKYAKNHDQYDYEIFSFVVELEDARFDKRHPEIPDELKEAYFSSIRELASIAFNEREAWDDQVTPFMVDCIALSKGKRLYIQIYSEEEAQQYYQFKYGYEPEETD